MKEKSYRSILKTLSWRALGTLDTVLISYIIIGQLEFAITIGFVELFTKMVLYFLHERTWDRISFGREIVNNNNQG